MLKIVVLRVRDLSDLWFQLISEIVKPGNARKRYIDQGSFPGQFRLEFDFIFAHVFNPEFRPIIPEMPEGSSLPPPTDMSYVDGYFARYLMSDEREGDEQYTYGERMTAANTSPIAHIGEKHTYLYGEKLPPVVDQIETIIDRYKKYGPGNNQLIIQVGQPADIILQDPPCLRHIDTRIEEGKLHFHIYFRSWDLWGGLPSNLGGIQLLKEYMSSEIGVGDGEMTCSSKGLHLYGYSWEVAGTRRGLTQDEMKKLAEVPKITEGSVKDKLAKTRKL